MGLLLLAQSVVVSADELKSLVGTKVDDFSVRDYRGKEHSLSDYESSKVVVLAFLGTECPLAKLYAPRLASLNAELSSRGVTFLGVNSNRQDSNTEVATHARRHGIEFPVLKDAGNRLADAIGVTRTPEIVVLDEKRVVRYHGRIDDQYGVGYIRDEVQKPFLKNAVADLLAGRKVKTPSTEVVGCFIGKIRKPKADSPVTYSNQVARILQKNCEECHREGEIAPFTLTKYEDVVGWGDTILEVIEDRRMPPWHADPEIGEFTGNHGLPDEDLATLLSWIEAGAPRTGDEDPLKALDAEKPNWALGEPDLILELPAFNVPASGEVDYEYPLVANPLDHGVWIVAGTIIPGDTKAVHHVLVGSMDEAPAEQDEGEVFDNYIMGYAPGNESGLMPEGTGVYVPAGGYFAFQMHYTPYGREAVDVTKAGFYFADEPPANYLRHTVLPSLEARWPEARLAYWHVQGRHEVDFVVDINEHKHGKYLAGTGHRIAAPDKIEQAIRVALHPVA